MAICFAHQSVVKAETGSSAVGLAAYMLREKMTDTVAGTTYNFHHRQEDAEEVRSGVVLPAGAAAELMNPEALWNSAAEAELTVDRKTGETRFKVGAQIAWHVVLALPKEVAIEQAAEMTREWIEQRYGAAHVAVQWAIHDDGGGNPHLHLQVSTRRLSADGWGKKARELAPAIRGGKAAVVTSGDRGELTAAWEQFQNDWFQAHGMDVRVDPMLVVADPHVVARDGTSELDQASGEARAAAAELMQDPVQVLQAIGKMQSTWTRRDLVRLVRRQGLEGEGLDAAVDAALAHAESVALADAVSGAETGRWSSRSVMAQERAMLERARRMTGEDFRPALAVRAAELANELTLSAEQLAVVERETVGAGRLAVIQGRAGTGKSHTLKAVQVLHEASGQRVVGIAPTNVVARSMASDGFRTAQTAHMALIGLENGWDRWDRQTVVVVDEAAMLSTEILDRVLAEADRTGARIILVGDDRQLQSVERGGMFEPIARMADAAELRAVRRQEIAWQRGASEAFAAGDMAAGIEAYAAHGCIAWNETLDESRAALVRDWAAATAANPDATRFIYASTNAEVRRLNEAARAIRVERGGLEGGMEFETSRGVVVAAVGDRVQFHNTNRRAGIFNGVLGTVTEVREDRIRVRTDDGTAVAWDPRAWTEWAHGYAGTVYRGQGKTQVEVHALYDHSYAWSPSASYVALTRQTRQLTLHVPRELAADQDALARQMSISRRAAVSVDFTEHVRREELVAAVDAPAQVAARAEGGAALPVSVERSLLAEFCAAQQQDRFRWLVEGQERLDALHEQAEAALMAWPRDAVDAEERESVEQYHRNYPVAMAAWSVARTVVGAVEAALADPGEETRMAAMRAIEAIEADSGHIWHEETRRFVSGELAARGVLLSAAAWLVEAKAAMGPTPAVVDAAGVAAQKKTAAENEAARVVVAWRAEIAQLAERVEAARDGGGTWTGAGPDALADEVRMALQRWPADQERSGPCRMFEGFLQDLALAREAGQRAAGFEQDARVVVRLVKAGAPDSSGVRRFLARVAAIEADAGRPWDDETLRRRAGQVKAKIAAGRQVVAWRAEIAQLAERVVAARAGAGTWTGAGPGALADEVRIAVQRWPADQERFGLCRMFEEFLQDLALAREAGQRAAGFEQDARAAVSLVKAGAPDSGAVQRFLARIAAIEADAGRPWDDETLRRRAGLVKAEIASARQVAATTAWAIAACAIRVRFAEGGGGTALEQEAKRVVEAGARIDLEVAGVRNAIEAVMRSTAGGELPWGGGSADAFIKMVAIEAEGRFRSRGMAHGPGRGVRL